MAAIVLSGPTMSGKTAWSLALAERFGGAVIAADSRTVYQSLDIGTNKVTVDFPAQIITTSTGTGYKVRGIEHYGIDLIDVRERYTAAAFQRYGKAALVSLEQRGLLPFLVGGTGLYIDAVVRGYQFPRACVLPNEWRGQPLAKKVAMLETRDPLAAATIDRSNPRRVDRALAYVLATGESWSTASRSKRPHSGPTLQLVINRPRPVLYERINRQVVLWVESGLFDEVSRLRAHGVSDCRLQEVGQVYRAALRVVTGEWSRPEFIHRLSAELRQYARRQLGWWRGRADVQWISSYTECERAITSWMSSYGEEIDRARHGALIRSRRARR